MAAITQKIHVYLHHMFVLTNVNVSKLKLVNSQFRLGNHSKK
jgi:hypothetical protein